MPPRKPPPPPAEGLLDLFGGQELPPAPVKPPEAAWGAAEGSVKWLKPLSGRPLCEHCTAAIHKSRDGSSPHVATTRRRGPNGDVQLCQQHAQMQRELDDKAEAARKERVRLTGERPAARRSAPKRHREHA